MGYSLKENLDDLMIDKNMNITQLSLRTNIAYKTLSNYLLGIYCPSLKNAIILANFFECSLDFLVGISEQKSQNEFFEPDNLFYERYKQLLSDRNISHYRVVKDLELNINISRKWKNGALPTLNVLTKLARYFDVSIDYLIGRKKL